MKCAKKLELEFDSADINAFFEQYSADSEVSKAKAEEARLVQEKLREEAAQEEAQLAMFDKCNADPVLKAFMINTMKTNRILMQKQREREALDKIHEEAEARAKKRGAGRGGKQFEDGPSGNVARFLAQKLKEKIPLPTEDGLAYSYKVSGWRTGGSSWGLNLVAYGLTLDEVKEKDFGQRLITVAWKSSGNKLEPKEFCYGLVGTIEAKETEFIKKAIHETLKMLG